MVIDDPGSSGDHDGTFARRLPAIIPRPVRPSAIREIWRFVLPHWRLIVVAAVASGVGVAGAKLWPHHGKLSDMIISLPASPNPPRAGDRADHASLPAADRPSLSTTLNRPAAVIGSETCHVRGVPQIQLVTQTPIPVLHVDEAALLGIRIDGAPERAELVICGFAPRSVISAGRSVDEKTWMLPVSEVSDATLIPPLGFVGLMTLDVVLMNADSTVADRRTLLLQWQPQTDVPDMPRLASVRKGDAEAEIDRLLDEGRRLQAAGNLPKARGIFLRFAQQSARAAFLYADSYDPITLAKRQLPPPESDLALARIWYRKASSLGSQDATYRLERLENW